MNKASLELNAQVAIAPAIVLVNNIKSVHLVLMAGPLLPLDYASPQPLIQHPSGGIIAMSRITDVVYYLAHAESMWVPFPQKILPRSYTTKLLVPDSVVNCS